MRREQNPPKLHDQKNTEIINIIIINLEKAEDDGYRESENDGCLHNFEYFIRN